MSYLEFRNTFKDFGIFSKNDIEKIYSDFNKMNLVQWQKKGYINKLRNSMYIFNDILPNESLQFSIANKIYSPSYISLESALNFYDIIPEGVFTFTSISTLKTKKFVNKFGYFIYTNLKPDLFFGYNIIRSGIHLFKIADIDKTILDILYLRNSINNIDDFESMRFNKFVLLNSLNFQIIDKYLQLFNSKKLTNKIILLKEFLK